MHTIVVPVSFSPDSVNAACYAADLALSVEADLHLLHVVPPSDDDQPWSKMQESSVHSLKELWEKLIKRTRGKVNIFVHVETGMVEYTIEEFCRSRNPLMVIKSTPSNALPYPQMIIPRAAAFKGIKKIASVFKLKEEKKTPRRIVPSGIIKL